MAKPFAFGVSSSPRTAIYIFRHGETDWNREHRFQGHTDIPLNEVGRTQAAELKKALDFLQPEILLTSDLGRARETADIVNRDLNLPVIEAVELREGRLGDPEGWLRAKIFEVYGEESWNRWQSVHPQDLDFRFPGGESKREHLTRLQYYLELFLTNRPNCERIAVSTHGGSIRRLVHACAGAPSEPVPLPNCGLFLIHFHHPTRSWEFIGQVE